MNICAKLIRTMSNINTRLVMEIFLGSVLGSLAAYYFNFTITLLLIGALYNEQQYLKAITGTIYQFEPSRVHNIFIILRSNLVWSLFIAPYDPRGVIVLGLILFIEFTQERIIKNVLKMYHKLRMAIYSEKLPEVKVFLDEKEVEEECGTSIDPPNAIKYLLNKYALRADCFNFWDKKRSLGQPPAELERLFRKYPEYVTMLLNRPPLNVEAEQAPEAETSVADTNVELVPQENVQVEQAEIVQD